MQECRTSRGSKPRPVDVTIVGTLLLLDAIGHVAVIFVRAGRSELFLGALWISNEHMRIFMHLVMAIYYSTLAVGIFRLRTYGLWMLVGLLVTSAFCIPLWWIWGRHFITTPSAPQPAGLGWLLVHAALTCLFGFWCIWRRRLFVRSKKGEIVHL